MVGLAHSGTEKQISIGAVYPIIESYMIYIIKISYHKWLNAIKTTFLSCFKYNR